MLWSYLSHRSMQPSLFSPFKSFQSRITIQPRLHASPKPAATRFQSSQVSSLVATSSRSKSTTNARFSPYLASLAGIGIAVSFYQPFTTVHCERTYQSTYRLPDPCIAATTLTISSSSKPLITAVPATSKRTPPQSPPEPAPLPPAPPSSVNLYELSFGTVCGVCAGVFVKKGAKLLAFALGGVFVLLQVSFNIRLVVMYLKKDRYCTVPGLVVVN